MITRLLVGFEFAPRWPTACHSDWSVPLVRWHYTQTWFNKIQCHRPLCYSNFNGAFEIFDLGGGIFVSSIMKKTLTSFQGRAEKTKTRSASLCMKVNLFEPSHFWADIPVLFLPHQTWLLLCVFFFFLRIIQIRTWNTECWRLTLAIGLILPELTVEWLGF